MRGCERPGDADAHAITATAVQVVYMLAKDCEIIADDDANVSFEADSVAIDGKTGKPVADVTRYIYRDADTRYVVSFERQKTILQAILTDRAPLFKRIIARLIGFDGAYHRFTGKVTIEKFEGGVRVERFDARQAGGTPGTVNRKTVPYGTFADTHNCPPCDSMIERQIESPMPSPSDFVVKKGSKIRCAIVGSSPAPVSSIVTSTPPGSVSAEDTVSSLVWSLTVLIASAAFVIRFSSTCCS
jgi:hypothetical protein